MSPVPDRDPRGHSDAADAGALIGAPPAAGEPLLSVSNLRVDLPSEDGTVHAVAGIDLTLAAGSTLGVVGESGAGKSVAALAVMGLLGDSRARVSGSVRFAGRDLLTLGERGMRAMRGRDMAMIFQDPLSALHPLKTVGSQIAEAVRAHGTLSRRDAHRRAVQLLDRVGIGDPARRARQHPHELSGGMRQRVMLAIALANEPRLLIADEPTTALDVTVQAQIIELLRELQAELSMALMLITHDLAVVAELADEVAVMYAGRVVELAPAARVFAQPEHPYTWGLIGSMPKLTGPRLERLDAIGGAPPSPLHPPTGCRFHPRCPHALAECPQVDPELEALADQPAHEVACLLATERRRALWRAREGLGGQSPGAERAIAQPDRRTGDDVTVQQGAGAGAALLEVRGLAKHFPLTRGLMLRRTLGSVHALDGITFDVRRGEVFGIVGESGCGKSTTARLLMRLLDPSAGSIGFDGADIVALRGRLLKALRRRIGMVFQDPY
ncbi:MAG: oligopeptide/dipeptide ABC transporter ATP-binding protein, partial [Solirubrobacteraceae bacterium]